MELLKCKSNLTLAGLDITYAGEKSLWRKLSINMPYDMAHILTLSRKFEKFQVGLEEQFFQGKEYNLYGLWSSQRPPVSMKIETMDFNL